MTLTFGTDGVRGPAEQFDAVFVEALGAAAAEVLADTGGASEFVIGRDTRESGAAIEAMLVAGLRRGGATPFSMGVVPTPAVAWVSAQRGIPGAVISASHNPWSDNGIKFFAAGGRKLADEVEARISDALDARLAARADSRPDARPAAASSADDTRHVADGRDPDAPLDDEAVGEWCAAVAATVTTTSTSPSPSSATSTSTSSSTSTSTSTSTSPSIGSTSTDGTSRPRVVIDCANGAASDVAARILATLDLDLEVLHAAPDGRNINASCGSTHPDDLQRRVIATGALLGLAFDGDADRIVAVDELGRLVDGDQLIAMFATDLRARDRLRNDAVVVTVMTNLGLRLAMAERGIDVEVTPVGDRHVIEALERIDGSLGGEQSGHIVFADLATTGDGILAGVQLIDLVLRSGRPLSELADASMTRLPQVLRNVAVARRRSDIADAIAPQIAAAEAELADTGRVLIRPSGTEPLVRVMVEAPTAEQAERIAALLAAAVDDACRA